MKIPPKIVPETCVNAYLARVPADRDTQDARSACNPQRGQAFGKCAVTRTSQTTSQAHARKEDQERRELKTKRPAKNKKAMHSMAPQHHESVTHLNTNQPHARGSTKPAVQLSNNNPPGNFRALSPYVCWICESTTFSERIEKYPLILRSLNSVLSSTTRPGR